MATVPIKGFSSQGAILTNVVTAPSKSGARNLYFAPLEWTILLSTH